ncbi:putative disease resistance protein [Platanthera zijinensis]|uniref:Disease resistance protein n=1 Tax=Platanthera zijinensis TaxID=2320716 RepID=A0AAP0B9V0_9ASPA
MAMILDAFVGKFTDALSSYVKEEVIMVLGVKDELQKLQQRMAGIQSLLNDAEKRKFDDSSVENWLAELKDVMYDADDIIDLCRIEGAQLLADQNHASKPSPACCGMSSPFPCFQSIPLRHAIGNRVKELNDRLGKIYENRKMFKFERTFTKQETQITLVNSRQTSSLLDEFVVGREVEFAANGLAELLLTEKVQEKCRLFAVTGMGGIGKTTLAAKIFNHSKIQTDFQLKIWVCISQTYSEIELLQQVIRGAKGSYGNANTKPELQIILRDSVVSGKSLFLVLDDVWRADVWVDLLRVPLQSTKTNVRILVTTRYEDVAREMEAARIHPVLHLSIESSWDMLRMRIFPDRQEELVNGLKQIGLQIVERCGGLPLAIKAIASVLARKDPTRKEWEKVLRDDAWSTTKLPEELRGALYLSFTDLPSHLKQCFLYCSLHPEDAELSRRALSRLWVAEGFVAEQKDSLMEDLAEDYFNELVRRNLLIPDPYNPLGDTSKMHDLFRSLALFLSKDESFCGEEGVKNSSTTLTKLRRLSVAGKEAAAEILDSVAEQGALRTLLASHANLTLNEERLRRLSHLRVLHIKKTHIETLPGSIGNLVHLRYLDLDGTHITAIPESIERLTNLQFLNIRACRYLKKLPNGITGLHNLRRLGLYNTPLIFIPKGIGKLQQLNDLSGFVVSNDNLSSKLEELNSLKQIRMLSICGLERAQSGAMILRELPQLSDLKLFFTEFDSESEPRMEEQNTVEKLLDELIPPRSLEELKIKGFFGRRFPTWMTLSTFEACTPFLTRLELIDITSCTQLPPLGQLPELKLLTIENASAVKKIGEEFLGGGENAATLIAFPKLEILQIIDMPELEEWCFGERLEQNEATRFKLMSCLRELSIMDTPLLKQLPQGLKYTAMKSLQIQGARSLRELGNLPSQTEELHISNNKNLLKICHLPALRLLDIKDCKALSSVERLDVLQQLTYFDYITQRQSLPEWLLNLLQNQTFYDFLFQLLCSEEVLHACLKGGSHWDVIQNIPRVIAYALTGNGYFRYSKKPLIYDTNV